ncbi:putative dehydrogenase [Gramella sp. Hel_I_59]|uniref:Gfo/Idh/MocA family protein n=1 Tax=Gramella sp. Hel_I_59 TaxID=1249978 RepID=UPI001153D7F7|nr:Gfo/Idh/MocA family oxidoreductase [Gramella sp. Hel_I_59]TQI70410.1 putative dehydrogenase [Gramella sp. Hel_I_59]
MGKEIKILLVGLGSIGRRHVQHLRSIEGVTPAALRTGRGSMADKSDITEFFELEDALNFHPDGVIISNPTSLHVETALPFLKEGIKVLIEKPIDYSISNATKLLPYRENIRVAYCLRFHPQSIFLKDLFYQDKPFKVGFKRSFYLPNWHPYADYRSEYTAQRKLGGGVIRTLSHEIDISLDWFGEPESVNGVVDKVSFLDMDVDDYAFFTLKSKHEARINFELDFFSPNNINTGEAFTDKGKYEWSNGEVNFIKYDDGKRQMIFSCPPEAGLQMYQNQMEDFCQFIKDGTSHNATLEDGLNVLKIIEQVEK